MLDEDFSYIPKKAKKHFFPQKSQISFVFLRKNMPFTKYQYTYVYTDLFTS